MKNYFLVLLLLFSCSSLKIEDEYDVIRLIQDSWKTKNIQVLIDKLGSPHKVEMGEKDVKYIYFTPGQKEGIGKLNIYLDKTNNTILAAIFWLSGKDSMFIQNTISSDDWKLVKKINRRNDHEAVDEWVMSSENLGASYLYDKFDPGKKIFVLYWGIGPENVKI